MAEDKNDGGAPPPDWYGTYLNENEIFADMLTKIKADPEGMKRWTDPASWALPIKDGMVEEAAPEHAGCLMFVGMQVRNYYGLWHQDCPHTLCDGPDLQIVDGIVTDSRFPDNMSGRIVDRVRSELAMLSARSSGDK